MLNNSIKKSIRYICGYSERTAFPHEYVGNEVVNSVSDLWNHKSSKCWILHTNSHIYLQSYNTIVSKYNILKQELAETKHSTTTSKQQTWFFYQLRDCCTIRGEECKIVRKVVEELDY